MTMQEIVARAVKAEIGRQLGAQPMPPHTGQRSTDWHARAAEWAPEGGSLDLDLIAQAALTAIQREHVIVPREPTEEMWEAGQSAIMDRCDCEYLNHRAANYAYIAMLAAAPTPK